MEDCHRDAWIVTQSAHPTVAWVESLQPVSFGAQRKVNVVIITDPFTQGAIGNDRSELLDPRVFVWQHPWFVS